MMLGFKREDPLVAWALSDLDPYSPRLVNYRGYLDYYEGRHPAAFVVSEKYHNTFWRVFRHFSLNLCSSVVDVQADMLEVTGFTSSAAKAENVDGVVRVVDAPAKAAWDAWELNDSDLVSDQVHRDALLFGDGFLVAEPDEAGDLRLWPQVPSQIAVRYSEESVPPRIEAAAKLWLESRSQGREDVWRLNLYDGTTVRRLRGRAAEGVPLKARAFADFDVADSPDLGGRVPVFHFRNRSTRGYGVSELRDVLPIQDALNKSVVDLLVAMEFQAFRQRWVAGAQLEEDPLTGKPIPPEHGPGAIFVFGDPETKLGEFGQADLSPFLTVKSAFQGDIARVSGVPLHYFFVASSEPPSGEALKTGELRFARKSRRQKRIFGHEWEDVQTVVVAFTGGPVAKDLNTVWLDVSPRSETETLTALNMKRTIGVPNSQLQKEAGYDDDLVEAFAAASPAELPPAGPGASPDPAAPDPVVPAGGAHPNGGRPEVDPAPFQPKRARRG